MQYTTENTEGYSSEDLATLNGIYEHRIALLDEDERGNPDLLHLISEQVLYDYDQTRDLVPDQVQGSDLVPARVVVRVVYKTEIEWLRARWMQEHACARYPDSAFARFAAPDLTAEEIRDCMFDDLDSLVEFVDHAEEGVYMILQRDRGLYWDGEGDWTANRDDAARYAPGEFPRTIESLQGLYTLTADGEIYGVPSEYRPPDDYQEEHEAAHPPDTKDYREPGEWLLDEYDDSLYVVREVREVYGEIGPARYP